MLQSLNLSTIFHGMSSVHLQFHNLVFLTEIAKGHKTVVKVKTCHNQTSFEFPSITECFTASQATEVRLRNSSDAAVPCIRD